MSKLKDIVEDAIHLGRIDHHNVLGATEQAADEIKALMLELIGEDIPGNAGTREYSGAEDLARKSWEIGRCKGINQARRELRQKVNDL